MPRPKRTKVAPSGPTQRARNPPHDATTSPRASNAPQREFDDLYDISDPEDRVVRSVQHVKKGNAREKPAATTPVRGRNVDAPTSKGRNHASETINVSQPTADTASHVVEEENDIDLSSPRSSPEVEIGRRERTTPAVARSAIKIGNFKRRPREPSILGRREAMDRSSSLDSDMADDDGLTSVGKRSAKNAGIGDSHRRQRELSVGDRNTTTMAPSSMALPMDKGTTPARVGSALKLGNFRRRAREPSILGTGRKPQQPRPDDEDEGDDDDEDDFNPEDESTPLNASRSKAMTSSSASGSNSRKRKLSAVQKPQSSPTNRSPRPQASEERIPATASVRDEEEAEGDNDMSSSPLSTPIASVEAPDTPEPMSETMAPPMSSSPASSPEPELPLTRPLSRGRGRRPTRGRTPITRTQDSPISSPPSLTHSPNRPYMTNNSKSKKVLPPPSAFSTAQLQALLPRRRRRGEQDPFDVPSSDGEIDNTGLASSDDELSHLNVRTRRQRSVVSRTPAPSRKSKAKPPLKSAAKRTYGARANPASDKENDEVDPDDSLAPLRDDIDSPEDSQELEARVGKELKQAARKFQEVDKWELEFEEVTASSSSPRDAR
ncbi:hypothetical protein GLAREA_05988 [Glarea lozoyensis ATCC 20868]|uniref:Uncharacterized protein n=1 Tax=Glarea lozoyensis (strain ATCC 20868 / MF5171) TaxID=1116229 RepID=S3DLP4_GLAL2|nr:uncharacterized protein GLAREA_05988 [Glarea lozoyensis ATCC 20868]EPE32976.1 hypothetical protein GLAREA_05988 [Glarea lozoyensis ATCC 20868]